MRIFRSFPKLRSSHRHVSRRRETPSRRYSLGFVRLKSKPSYKSKPVGLRLSNDRYKSQGERSSLEKRPLRLLLVNRERPNGFRKVSNERKVAVGSRLGVHTFGDEGQSQRVPVFSPGSFAPKQSVCRARATRKSVLFAARVAGFGSRRSPGAGGSYNRISTSNVPCERSL